MQIYHGFEPPPVSSIAHKHILSYHPYCMVYIYLHELVDFYGICFLVRSIIPIPWIFMASHATWLQLRSCTLQQWDLQEVDAILLHPESGSSTRKRRFREKKTVGSLVGVFSTTEKLEKQILKHNLLGSNIGSYYPQVLIEHSLRNVWISFCRFRWGIPKST